MWDLFVQFIEKGLNTALLKIIKKLKVSLTTLLKSLINIVGIDLYLFL